MCSAVFVPSSTAKQRSQSRSSSDLREYRSRSSLARGTTVLSLEDARRLSRVVSGIHDHFRSLLDPEGSDRWFAMDIEAKLVGPDRLVAIKQARPFNFGRVERPSDCREY